MATRTFRNHVHITNPDTGQPEIFEPGDDAPSWVTDEICHRNNFMQEDDEFDTETGEVRKALPSYKGVTKDELLAQLTERGLDTSPGSKEDFVARLQADDASHG